MRLLALLAFAVFGTSILGAQSQTEHPPGFVKEWRFPVKGGQLLLTLSSLQNELGQRVSLSITTVGTDASPTVEDESVCIQKVISEMPALGYSPSSISSIHMGILEPETLAELQLAAANSREWNDCVHAKSCRSGAQIVLKLLQGLGVYDRLNRDLGKYGLIVKLTYLEDMFTRPVADPRNGENSKSKSTLILPVVGLLEFQVAREHTSS
jgi:hypothetical protein